MMRISERRLQFLLAIVVVQGLVLQLGTPLPLPEPEMPPGGTEKQMKEEEESETAVESIFKANEELLKMGHWFEMDIVRTQKVEELVRGGELTEESSSVQTPDHRPRRGGVANDNLLWPNARVPYAFDGFIGDRTRQVARLAMEHWMNHTCLQFVPKNRSDSDYILFVEEPGCWSYVGRQDGGQRLSLGEDNRCKRMGTIVHELGHAIGFWHEQSRPDRNLYITILWDNIRPNSRHNFRRYSHGQVDSLNVTYDYGSIMHYPTYAFSMNGEPTIQPTQPGARIGQRNELSPLDIEQANLLYRCPPRSAPTENTPSPVNVNVTLDIPSEAFLIQSRHTNTCLYIRTPADAGDVESSSTQSRSKRSLYEVILTECEPLSREQYWRWAGEDQLLHVGTFLCLTSSGTGNVLVLRPCNDNDPSQKWACAGSFIEQPQTQRCITAKVEDLEREERDVEIDLEAALDNWLSRDSHQTYQQIQLITTLEDCESENALQVWNAESENMSETEDHSICANASTHMLSQCYVKSMEHAQLDWITCNHLGYYVAGLYHIDQWDLATLTGMECCATSSVFTGRPQSPIADHAEECHELEWWSYSNDGVAEGWFRCPTGTYLKGFYFSSSQGLHGIRRVRCCKPRMGPSSYMNCYNDQIRSVENSGGHTCSLSGYHITGVYKTDCSQFDCIEQFTCCM